MSDGPNVGIHLEEAGLVFADYRGKALSYRVSHDPVKGEEEVTVVYAIKKIPADQEGIE